MPTPAMIWSEAFHRASREELGIVLTVDNPQRSLLRLHHNRPEGFQDYTVCRTDADPNIILIVKPGVDLIDPDALRELGLTSEDLTPDLED